MAAIQRDATDEHQETGSRRSARRRPAGDQVTAAQIDGILAAEQTYLGAWEPTGPTEINIAAQATELNVPDVYVLDDYTLVLPIDWLEQEYGASP